MSIRKAVKPQCPHEKLEESRHGDWKGASSPGILRLKWETAVWPQLDWDPKSSLTIDYDSCGRAFPLGDNVFGHTSVVCSIREAGLLDDEVVIDSNIKIPICNRINDIFIFQPFHLKMHERNRSIPSMGPLMAVCPNFCFAVWITLFHARDFCKVEKVTFWGHIKYHSPAKHADSVCTTLFSNVNDPTGKYSVQIVFTLPSRQELGMCIAKFRTQSKIIG